MFAKIPKSDQTVAAPDRVVRIVKSSIPSIISADLRITGDLVCSGDVQIDGWIEGNVQSRHIVVGEGATVQGRLQAEEVRIAGLLNGDVLADLVVLAKTAHVNGDVLHKSLAVEEGAYLQGMCRRLDTYVAPAVTAALPVESAQDGK